LDGRFKTLKSLKILFFTYLFPSYKGDIKGNFVLNRWERLARHSYLRIEGLIPTNYHYRNLPQPSLSFKIHRFYIFSSKRLLGTILGLLDYVAKSFFYILIHRPTLLVLDYGYPEALFVVPIVKILRIKICIAPKGSDIDEVVSYRLPISKMVLWSYNLADYIIPLSEIMKKKLLLRKIQSKKITIIPQSFKTNLYKENPRRKNSDKNSRIIITMVGALIKRQDLLIKIFPRLHELYPKLEIWLIGGGSNLESLKSKASFTNLIQFFGYVSDKKKLELLAETDIYIHLSDHEELPTAILEIMYFGLPIIGSKVGGIPKLLSNEFGILVKNNENDIISAISQLIEDEKLRGLCILNAKKKIQNYLPKQEIMKLKTWIYSIFQTR